MEGEQPQGSEQAEKMVTISQAELDRKFNKTRKNAQAETEARIRREYAARAPQPEQPQQPRQQPAELKEPERPKREAFPDYEAYLEAREKYLDEKAKYEGTRAARAERERMQQEDTERKMGEARATLDREFSKHAKAVIAEHPEIAEAIENADDVQMSAAMGDAIKEAGEIGVYVLHYLVEHPEEAERIAALSSESAQTRAIGKIEAKVEAEREKKKPKKDDEEEEQEENRSERRDEGEGERSDDGRFKAQEKGRKAPEPIEPGTGRSANLDRGPNDKDSDKSWFEKRLAQERAERERRTRK